jgi:peptidase M1-like protein
MIPRLPSALFAGFLVLMVTVAPIAAQSPAGDVMSAYKSLHAFVLDGGSANVNNLTLKRDRGEMTFTGTFYFPQPVLGKITGAVFIGQGKFRAEPPPSSFEKDNVQRLLKADVVESDFQTAVLRFTDDTFSIIGQSHEPRGTVVKQAQDVALEFEPRMLRETGANIASRLLLSMLNVEQPGVFIAQFDKGSRGRFTYVLDLQCRIPTVNFDINGGEKGLIFAYKHDLFFNEVWFAFYSQADYQRGRVGFSDESNLVDTPNYSMQVDLREPRKAIKVNAKTEMVARTNGVRAVPFALTEGLSEYDQLRKKKGMHITSAKLDGQTPLEFIQEEWEGGFLVVLPAARQAKDHFALEMAVEGDFVYDQSDTLNCSYPFINGEWYPRHGYLTRSRFEITFHHSKNFKVAGPGNRVKEAPAPGDSNEMQTTYRIDQAIALVTFAMGPYRIHSETRKLVKGELPVEFFSLEGIPIKEDFITAEMGNAVDYMGALFGTYPYPIFRAAFHPFGFGQGFATMLAIPNADSARKRTFVFLAHETAHQWWGNTVAWRSYRDQWLSEGFAEYSGLLYMRERTKSAGDLRELLVELRDSLKEPPRTDTGIGSKRVTDIGPIILGHRLSTSRSMNAYTILTYNKGALVLRMLHFLFTNPGTGNGQPFFDMMQDFVNRYRDNSASTEQFAQVASEHFARTPIAQKYGLTDLNWFFRQWVWQTALPGYRLYYTIDSQPDGKFVVKGNVFQDNAPEDWIMPLPLVIKFGGDKVGRGTILAKGPQQPVSITLPARPESIELDPELWVLSEKTSTKKP